MEILMSPVLPVALFFFGFLVLMYVRKRGGGTPQSVTYGARGGTGASAQEDGYLPPLPPMFWLFIFFVLLGAIAVLVL